MDSKDAIITELRRLVAGLERQLQWQAERISELELQLAKAKKDSSTSSKPPSSDIVKPPAKKKTGGRRGKRKGGGQPGHKRQLRQLLPPERVDERFDYEINDQDVQRLGLTPTDQFETIQHIEFPESPIHVTEHRLQIYLSPSGDTYVPNCPELSSQPIFGPRMLAMVGWLKSKAHCSYTTIEYLTDPSQPLQTYDLSQDYFRFLFAAEIEPTNNHSEQQIRHCVIDRRITQGTRGEAGQRYHERMWTAIATCGKQNRSFFHFLRQSIAANLNNQPAPSLLTS